MDIISIVIPMYNEEKIINDTITQVDFYLRSNFGDNYEIVAADDGSTDSTFAMLTDLTASFPHLRVISHPGRVNRGKGAAVRNGMLSAAGDIAVFTDCDLSYGLDVIARIADVFAADPAADIVIGSRNISRDGYDGYTVLRRIMSKLYIKLLTAFAGLRYSDSQSGIKGFRRDTAQQIFRNCEIDRFAFDLEVLMTADKLNCTVREIGVKVLIHNESKVRIVRDTLRMLRDIRKIRKRLM